MSPSPKIEFLTCSPADLSDGALSIAVIVAWHQDRWVFVKHKLRDTLELPAGHREANEDILRTAHRELYEETGATRYHLVPLNRFRVRPSEGSSFGLLCFAWIDELGPLPHSEIEKTVLLESCPRELTYPGIQSVFFDRVARQTALLRKVQPYSHLIWDWNGTLLDDVSLCVEVISTVLHEYRLPTITLEQYRAIFGFPVIDYYRKLGFDFSRYSFEEVGDKFIARYHERATTVGLFDGARLMLEILSRRQVHQSILSAAAQTHLDEITRRHQIDAYFQHIFGIDNHYAASKLERGRELIRTSGIDPSKTLFIGDTDHDLEVGHALGTDVLLVADGHQDYTRLAAMHGNVLRTRFE
ncbi:MAG TPA: HAD hydrolase-like protein [Bdellovibrionota bacterium]|nr:HAD hydrolase-like protein [Bdellovibrionota bacterium]